MIGVAVVSAAHRRLKPGLGVSSARGVARGRRVGPENVEILLTVPLNRTLHIKTSAFTHQMAYITLPPHTPSVDQTSNYSIFINQKTGEIRIKRAHRKKSVKKRNRSIGGQLPGGRVGGRADGRSGGGCGEAVAVLEDGGEAERVHPLDHGRSRLGGQIEAARVAMLRSERVLPVDEAVAVAGQARADRVAGQQERAEHLLLFGT